MAMTVGELRALIDGLDDTTEVRLATQPNYPFESSIAGTKLVNPSQGDIEEVSDALAESRAGGANLTPEEVTEAEARLKELEQVPEIFYLAEGSQLGYADRDLWSF